MRATSKRLPVIGTSLAAVVVPLLAPTLARAADTNGAGGSPFGQIFIATIAATVVTSLLLWLGLGHRSGKVRVLGKAADFTARVSGYPGWAALPIVIAATSLVIAVFGMYWDISLHVDVGRDPGPLANPAHYFILVGLFGIFSAGYIAIMLPSNSSDDEPGPTALWFSPKWPAPLGGVLICACGAFALIGFPLDDIWHRLFGQDVTLWGPTHLMLIGGASMTLIGICVLATEGLRANALAVPPKPEKRAMRWVRAVALSGGLLIGLSTFQAEFDFGFPQFRMIFGPALVMMAAGIGLVSVRVWGGRGSAIAAVAFYLLLRGLLAVIIGPILGETVPAAPLYLVSALVIEAIALVIPPKKAVAFSLAAGVGIGTIGLASEWAWSHVVMPLPWPSSLLATGIPFGFAAAVCGALVGGWIGTRLREDTAPSSQPLRVAALVGALGVAAIMGLGLNKTNEIGPQVTVALHDVPVAPDAVGGGGRNVTADITVTPAKGADNALWFTLTAWQGGGLVIDHLQSLGGGRYRTTKPIPVHGSWKALLRLHVGRSLMAAPVYMPLDTAIPAPEVPATAQFTRTFVPDYQLMQREQKATEPWLATVAYLVIGSLAFLLLVLLVWGLHRMGDPDLAARPGRRPRKPARAPRPASQPTPVP